MLSFEYSGRVLRKPSRARLNGSAEFVRVDNPVELFGVLLVSYLTPDILMVV